MIMGNPNPELSRYVDAIRRSGLSIYDPIEIGNPALWIPTPELEALLDEGLRGISLAGLPIRSRSKSRKAKCMPRVGLSYPRII